MKRIQKAIFSSALVLTLITPARASLGISFAAPGAVIAGVATMGIAAGGGYGGYRLIKTGKPVLGGAVIVLSLAVGLFGLGLLDGGQKAEFSELSEDAAAALGVTPYELETYNSEIEQVNAIAREIGSELLKQKSDSPALARELWMELGTELSPETMKTVIAIAQQK